MVIVDEPPGVTSFVDRPAIRLQIDALGPLARRVQDQALTQSVVLFRLIHQHFDERVLALPFKPSASVFHGYGLFLPRQARRLRRTSVQPCQRRGHAVLAEDAVTSDGARAREFQGVCLVSQLDAIPPGPLDFRRDRPIAFDEGPNQPPGEVILTALERARVRDAPNCLAIQNPLKGG